MHTVDTIFQLVPEVASQPGGAGLSDRRRRQFIAPQWVFWLTWKIRRSGAFVCLRHWGDRMEFPTRNRRRVAAAKSVGLTVESRAR